MNVQWTFMLPNGCKRFCCTLGCNSFPLSRVREREWVRGYFLSAVRAIVAYEILLAVLAPRARYFSLFAQRKLPQRNAPPEALNTSLRFSPASALASTRRRQTTPLGLKHEASDIPDSGCDARAPPTGVNGRSTIPNGATTSSPLASRFKRSHDRMSLSCVRPA